MSKANNNSFVYFLSLPFIGIFYCMDFFFKVLDYAIIGFNKVFRPLIVFLKYVSLGCYYSVYGLFYPTIYLFDKTVDKAYEKKSAQFDANITNELVPTENTNEDSNGMELQEEKPLSLKEYLKERFSQFSFIVGSKKKEEQQIHDLMIAVQRDNTRSDKPIAFKYIARDSDGKKVVNTFIAYSKMEVFTHLDSQGMKVLSITTSKLINLLYGPDSSVSVRLSKKDLIFLITQLSTYIKAGIPLVNAMHILNRQMSNKRSMKRLFDSLIYNLNMGESFSSALAKQGKTFPALLISMIKTAEVTGELESTLDDMSNYYTEMENTRKAMINALMYPLIVSIFAIGVVVFILLYVMPQFENIYAQVDAQLNFFTVFLLDASKFLQANIFYILLGIVIIGFIIYILYSKIKTFRTAFQKASMVIPVFGKIIIYKEMSTFSKTFASLLKNSVSITDSMELLSEVTNNEIYKEIMYKTVDNITRGEKISSAFYKHWAVPDVAYYMIVTGESTGELANMMSKVADYYALEHRSLINNMKSFIEPVMIIVLAVVVGGIVLAIIMPMFGLYSQIS